MPDPLRALIETLEVQADLFEVTGRMGFIILPGQERSAAPRPWVWYAPTLTGVFPDSSHSWIFRKLLDKGIAVAGVDVGESWGNRRGRVVYDRFCKKLCLGHGLSEKPALFPQSRGGPMLYNWAAANPDRVACIGAIFPVCDLGALDDLELVGSAYGMDANSFLEDLHEYNPIDHLAPLVDAGVPILHVHGERDELIPLDLHTGELARRYRRLGGEIRVITIPGVGHEVHPAFFRCQALVEFLIRHSIPM